MKDIIQMKIAGLLGGLAVIAGGPCGAECPPRYEIAAVIVGPDCGDPWGPAGVSPSGMNDQGCVVGAFQCVLGPYMPFLWEDGELIELDLPEGVAQAGCTDINEAGVIAGKMGEYISPGRAFVIDGDEFIVIEPPPEGNYTDAKGLNEDGTVVGKWKNTSHGPVHAYIWRDGEFTDLHPWLEAPTSLGADVNDAGQVAGSRWKEGAEGYTAFIWHDGEVTDLGPIPGGFGSMAKVINNTGQVAGDGEIPADPSYDWHGFFYSDGVMIDIGTLPTFRESRVFDMNDDGTIVGVCEESSEEPRSTAFVWRNGTMWNLNDLIPPGSGFYLSSGRAINSAGQIVVRTFGAEAVLLTPVPWKPGDIDCNDKVNVHDLLTLLGSWGPCPPPPDDCDADLDGDGEVNAFDLLILLRNWGLRSDPT